MPQSSQYGLANRQLLSTDSIVSNSVENPDAVFQRLLEACQAVVALPVHAEPSANLVTTVWRYLDKTRQRVRVFLSGSALFNQDGWQEATLYAATGKLYLRRDDKSGEITLTVKFLSHFEQTDSSSRDAITSVVSEINRGVRLPLPGGRRLDEQGDSWEYLRTNLALLGDFQLVEKVQTADERSVFADDI